MKINVLKANAWLDLRELVAPEYGIESYVFSHETRCRGQIVSILPFRSVETPSGEKTFEFLLREETVPCWDPRTKALCSVTGGVEGADIVEDVLRELKEETGFNLDTDDRLIFLGPVRGTKSTDTQYFIFTADVTGLEPGVAEGDGSEAEKNASTRWVKDDDLYKSEDPMTYVAFFRLMIWFRTGDLYSQGAEAVE